jgi:hypothetical protein
VETKGTSSDDPYAHLSLVLKKDDDKAVTKSDEFELDERLRRRRK